MAKKRKTVKRKVKQRLEPNLLLILALLIILVGFFLLSESNFLTGAVIKFQSVDDKVQTPDDLVTENLADYNNPLNVEFSEDGEYTFVIKEHPQNFNLKSLKLSGKIFGSGDVKAYFETSGKRYLVLDDRSIKEDGSNGITGSIIAISSMDADFSVGITAPEMITETESSNASVEEIIESNESIEEEIISEEAVEEIDEPETDEEVTEIVEEIEFDEACLETCSLPSGLNSSELKLVFEIKEGSRLVLTKVAYSLEDLASEEKEIEFDPGIKDSNNELVEYDLEIEDAETKTVEVSEQIRKPQGLGVASKLKVKLKKGEYNIKIVPKNSPISSIEFYNLDLSSNIDKFIDIDDVEETGELSKYIEVYAIDPTAINFSSATVTVTAKGTSLYKCKDWNFTRQSCYGSWELFKTGLVPGQDYTFILTPDDPGFGEYNQSDFDGGTYYQTFYNTSGFVQLNATYNNGSYTSQIFDAGSTSNWTNISWLSNAGELLDNQGIDTTINMSGNILLMHMNE
ncbi:MAG: hypothetical protein KJ984_03290, partial [Nanoarchaeota archaeon]|nr:hypothetical protein [Nanoarchaeota archaeon]